MYYTWDLHKKECKSRLYCMVSLKVDSIGGERMRNMNNNARSTSHELGFVMGVHIRWLPVTCSPFSTPSQFSWNTRRVANGRRVFTILPPDSYSNLTSVKKKSRMIYTLRETSNTSYIRFDVYIILQNLSPFSEFYTLSL